MTEIRLIHNLQRSGGTIISKCLGAQDDVVLLSEIHPNGIEVLKKMKRNCDFGDPIFQAQEWNELFKKEEYEKIKNTNYNFEEKISLIVEKTEEKNKKLIIRDWSFLDYFGIPFVKPTYKNSVLEILDKKFKILNLYILRHPLELYISCFNSLPFFIKNYNFDFFVKGYENFFLNALKSKIFKFEDFCNNPEENLKSMCKILRINFNDNFSDNLNKIKLTGDGKALASTNIQIKDDVAPILIKKEDKDKINHNANFVRLMENIKKYY